MKKRPYVSDYGGHHYHHDTPMAAYGAAIDKDRTLSLRCKECNALRFVTRLQVARAARPACLKCGGTLIESASQAHRTRHQKKRVERTAIARCPACGSGFKSAEYLTLHYQHFPDCAPGAAG